MPSIWFLVFLAICAPFAVRAAVRGYRGEAKRGEQINRPAVVIASAVILIAFGLFAAVLLGFIPDHAP